MSDLKNELSWSFSRMRLFDSCRRRYYYQHYLKWNGWNREAEPERQVAYRLSKMKSLEILCGELVHKGIEDALRRFRNNGVVVSAEETIEIARGRWTRSIGESQSGAYLREPKKCCCLMEDYYKQERIEERIDAAWRRLETCLRNFHESSTWSKLRRSKPNHWLAMDGDAFQTADIEGVAVHARPDLGYAVKIDGDERKRCWVFDWKTGKPRDSDVLQVRYYTLYAQHVWGFPPEAVRARLIYLYPELVEREVTVDAEALEDARRVLVQSNRAMREVLEDEAANSPRDIAYFPVTNRPVLCRYCSYLEICGDRPGMEPDPEPDMDLDYSEE